MTWQLSGLGDEITEMFPTQLHALNELGIPNVEIRRFRLPGGEQKVINEATDHDLDRLNLALAEAGITCAGVASPVGKYPIEDPFEPDFERSRGSVRAARRLSSPYLRVFSSYVPAGGLPAATRDEVMRRLREIAALAASEIPETTVVVENESGLYGEVVAACVDIFETIDGPEPENGLRPLQLRGRRRRPLRRGLAGPQGAHRLLPHQRRARSRPDRPRRRRQGVLARDSPRRQRRGHRHPPDPGTPPQAGRRELWRHRARALRRRQTRSRTAYSPLSTEMEFVSRRL